MRAILVSVVLAALAGCGSPSPEAAKPAAPAPATAPADPHAGHAHADVSTYVAAGPEWLKVPLAEGAVAPAAASTEVPPTFRNGAGKVACPVMGMAIDAPDKAVSYADHDGVRYFFCCDSCEKLFLDDPVAYANGRYLAEHALDPTAPASCADVKSAG
ncbi:MAG: YHS domain-containing protein [Myxococcota bacterium]